MKSPEEPQTTAPEAGTAEAEIRKNDPEWDATIWVCHRCDAVGFPPLLPTLCTDPACPMALASRMTEQLDRLRSDLEATGEAGGICVGKSLGRRCRYCQCGGKNLNV